MALTRVSRATAQRIISKKVELASPSIDEAPTVTKVALDDFDQCVARRTIDGMYAQKKRFTLMYCNRLRAWWSTQSRLETLFSSLIACQWVEVQTP